MAKIIVLLDKTGIRRLTEEAPLRCLEGYFVTRKVVEDEIRKRRHIDGIAIVGDRRRESRHRKTQAGPQKRQQNFE